MKPALSAKHKALRRYCYGKFAAGLGFSIIEVILAAALFVIFASGAAGVVIGGLQANRLAQEQAVASQYASQGLEAVRSIRSQNYDNLVSSLASGISTTPGTWAFAGSSNTFDKYTRVITVSDVLRNASGAIVASGGNIDPKTKKITSTVTWNVTAARSDSVVASTYLTNWRVPKGGTLVFGDGGTASDRVSYQIFDGTSWSAAQLTADVDPSSANRALRAARLYASTTRNEKILLSKHFNGSRQFIYAQVYNGTSWANVQLLSDWGDNSSLYTYNFDGAYLANGDFMAIYSDNTSLPKFRIFNGTTWSTQQSLVDLSNNNGDIPVYIVVKARPGTNEVMAAFFDQSSTTNTQYFNGGSYTSSNWTLHASHGSDAPSNDREMVSFSWSPYSATKGSLIYSATASDRAMNLQVFTANGTGGGSWSTGNVNTTNQGTLGPMAQTGSSIASTFIACDRDTNRNINCFKANITATPLWSNPANRVITRVSDADPVIRGFDLAFEALSGTTAIVVYGNDTRFPRLKKYNLATNTFDSTPTTLPSLGNGSSVVLENAVTIPLPGSDDIMILLSNTNNDLFSVVWNGDTNAPYSTGARAFTAHGTTGSDNRDIWYAYAWDAY